MYDVSIPAIIIITVMTLLRTQWGPLIYMDCCAHHSSPVEVFYRLYRQTFSNELEGGICLWPVAQMTLLPPLHFRDEGSMVMSLQGKREKELKE